MSFYGEESGAAGIVEAYGGRLVPWLFEHWADRVVGVLRPRPSAGVVDLACGTGLVTRSLLRHLDVSGRVHGVDTDNAMLAYASRRIVDPRVSWSRADASQVPVATSSVDAVVCNQGLQFFSNRAAVLVEVARVLRPRGRLAVAVWGPLGHNPWPAAMASALGGAMGDDARRRAESVCGLGDPEDVVRLLAGAGLVQVEATEVRVTVAHPDVQEAIDGQLACLPSAGAIEALGPEGRSDIIRNMADLLDPYTNAEGALTIPSSSVLATGTAPS